MGQYDQNPIAEVNEQEQLMRRKDDLQRYMRQELIEKFAEGERLVEVTYGCGPDHAIACRSMNDVRCDVRKTVEELNTIEAKLASLASASENH